MVLKRRYVELAFYNAWANSRIYDRAAALSDSDYRADHGAFFGSLHGTLNHLLVADRLWMARFREEPAPKLRLDQILFDDLSALRQAREAIDADILRFVEAQDEASLARPFTYQTVSNPVRITQPLAPAFDHFFNHQTHHRGQAHMLLTRITGDAPSLDLIGLQREAKLGGVVAQPL